MTEQHPTTESATAVCAWCGSPDVQITMTCPDWREGGTVVFCCEAHGHAFAYSVSA